MYLRKSICTLLAISCVLALPALALRATSRITPGAARVQFSIGNQLFAQIVDGSFKKFSGQIVYDSKEPQTSHIKWRVDAASIDTGNKTRDKHLRSADYLYVKKYPAILFESHAVTSPGPDMLAVTGNLTLCGVTKEVTVPVTLANGVFDCKFHLFRSDYGMAPDTILAANEMDIHLQVQQYAVDHFDWNTAPSGPTALK